MPLAFLLKAILNIKLSGKNSWRNYHLFSGKSLLISIWLRKIISFQPFFTGGTNFFFPDRYDFLQTINAKSSCFENTRVAMRGRTGNYYSWSARIKPSYSLDYADSFDGHPACTDFVRNLFHLCFCHWLIGFVFKHCGFMGVAFGGNSAHHPCKDRSRSGRMECDLLKQSI